MISIIMPSYLENFNKYAAKNRGKKFIRAVESVLAQTYRDWELVIISDGCQKTIDLASQFEDKRIVVLKTDKCPPFSGTPRNIGLKAAKGKWMIYLDTDDMYIETYLEKLVPKLKEKQWYWVDDIIFSDNMVKIRRCDIDTIGRCGTSNVIHRPGIYWIEKATYGHDWMLIKEMKKKWPDYEYIDVVGYCVMHIPRKYDL